MGQRPSVFLLTSIGAFVEKYCAFVQLSFIYDTLAAGSYKKSGPLQSFLRPVF